MRWRYLGVFQPRTATPALPLPLLSRRGHKDKRLRRLADPRRFERPAFAFGGYCSRTHASDSLFWKP